MGLCLKFNAVIANGTIICCHSVRNPAAAQRRAHVGSPVRFPHPQTVLPPLNIGVRLVLPMFAHLPPEGMLAPRCGMCSGMPIVLASGVSDY